MAELDQPTLDNLADTPRVNAFYPTRLETHGPRVSAFAQRLHERMALDPDVVFVGALGEQG